jgi:hypothetical protein
MFISTHSQRLDRWLGASSSRTRELPISLDY